MTTRRPRQSLPRHTAFLALALAGSGAHAFDTSREDVSAFVTEMNAEHGFDTAELTAVLAEAQSDPGILSRIAKPAEKTLTMQAPIGTPEPNPLASVAISGCMPAC